MTTWHHPLFEERDKWGRTEWEVIDHLLDEELGAPHALFGEASEGEHLPTGIQSASSHALTSDGSVQRYILKWDENKQAPDGSKGYYTLLKTVTYSPEGIAELGKSNAGYLRARKELGLPLTEKQQKILQKWEEEHKVR